MKKLLTGAGVVVLMFVSQAIATPVIDQISLEDGSGVSLYQILPGHNTIDSLITSKLLPLENPDILLE